jgi:hypothetical protein
MSSFAEAAMDRATVLSIDFKGNRDISGPLAWGQQALWNAIRRTRPEDRYFNFSRDFTMPQDHEFGVDEVAAALSRVLGRHEALRTMLAGDDERPVQTVVSAGRLEAAVLDCPTGAVDEVTARTMIEYEASTFDYFAELPLRVAVVVAEGRVARVVFCFCHLAADFNASQIVLRDFEHYLSDPTMPEDAPQPLDLVGHQHSDAGQRSSDRALAHWESEYRRIPPTMFPVQVAAPQDPPYWTGAISSAALTDAVPRAARRYEVTSSAVILAACAGLAAELSGHDLCAMLAIVGNRFRPRQRDLVSSLSMEGLLTVDIDRSGSFSALASRTWAASVDTYRFAEYDENGRDALFARVNRDRGQLVHPYCCYNDLRAEPDRAVDVAGEPDLRAAMARTEFRWARKLPKVSCRFCLHIVGGTEMFRIDLTADTRFLPPDHIERYLRAVERLLVEAAGRDVPLDEFGEMLR